MCPDQTWTHHRCLYKSLTLSRLGCSFQIQLLPENDGKEKKLYNCYDARAKPAIGKTCVHETCYIEDSMSTNAIHPHFGTASNRFLKFYDSSRERLWGLGPKLFCEENKAGCDVFQFLAYSISCQIRNCTITIRHVM